MSKNRISSGMVDPIDYSALDDGQMDPKEKRVSQRCNLRARASISINKVAFPGWSIVVSYDDSNGCKSKKQKNKTKQNPGADYARSPISQSYREPSSLCALCKTEKRFRSDGITSKITTPKTPAAMPSKKRTSKGDSVLRRIVPVPPAKPVQDNRSKVQASERASVLSGAGIGVVAVSAGPAVVQVGNVVALNNVVVAIA